MHSHVQQSNIWLRAFVFVYDLWLEYITLFRSITKFRGTNTFPQNIPWYFPHLVCGIFSVPQNICGFELCYLPHVEYPKVKLDMSTYNIFHIEQYMYYLCSTNDQLTPNLTPTCRKWSRWSLWKHKGPLKLV